MNARFRVIWLSVVLFPASAACLHASDDVPCLQVPRFCTDEAQLRVLEGQRQTVFELLDAGDYLQAVSLQEQLLEADSLLLGDHDRDVALDRALLGCALSLADRPAEADSQFRCVLGLERCDAAPRADVLDTVVDLEVALMSLPEFDDSLLFDHLLRVAETSAGTDSLVVAGVLPRLSLLAASEDDLEGAEAMAERAIRIIERNAGPSDGRLADVLNKSAVYAWMNCNLARAHAAFVRAANVALAAGSPFADDAPFYLENDATMFSQDGDRGFAAELNRLAVLVRRQICGLGN